MKSRITNKNYFYGNDQIITVHEVNGKYYYNKRESNNAYSKVYVSANNVVSLHRTYGKATSFPLTRTIVKMANPISGPMSPYVAIIYHAQQITESAEVVCHGNAIQESQPYFRTSKDVLEKTKEILSKGMGAKKVYDQVNSESGGVFFLELTKQRIQRYSTDLSKICKFRKRKERKQKPRPSTRGFGVYHQFSTRRGRVFENCNIHL